MGKHLDHLRKTEEDNKQEQDDLPHNHVEEWMADIDASLEENAWRPSDE